MATYTSELGSAPRRRRHREEQIEGAYHIQRNAAIKGALIWTFIGGTACVMAHHLYPGFRRQTLALKGFLTSGAAIFGFTTHADSQLLDHEGRERTMENRIRNLARAELGRQGIIASEAEIEKWKQGLKDEYRQKQQQQSAGRPSQPQIPPPRESSAHPVQDALAADLSARQSPQQESSPSDDTQAPSAGQTKSVAAGSTPESS